MSLNATRGKSAKVVWQIPGSLARTNDDFIIAWCVDCISDDCFTLLRESAGLTNDDLAHGLFSLVSCLVSGVPNATT